MALDFPNSPQDQDLILLGNGITYRWDASPAPGTWSAVAGPPGATELNNLSDVIIGAPVDGEMLIYDVNNLAFVNVKMYAPAAGYIQAPEQRKYMCLYGFTAPHIVEDLRITCEAGNGTVHGIIRSGVVDTAISGVTAVIYNTGDTTHVATANNLIAVHDSLLLEVVVAAGVTDLSFRFRVRRLFT